MDSYGALVAIISFLVIRSLSILVSRIASSALIQTGLSKEAARFQTRSAFSGAGFTTNESELVVNHPVRRKILMMLIFLGSVGVISTISMLILSFISLEQIGYFSIEMVVLVAGLIALLLFVQSKWIDRKLSYLINRALNRYTSLDVRDFYSLLHLSDNYRVSEIKVEQQDWLADKTLHELQLDDEGMLVLGIKRSNGEYIGAPRGETKIYNDDTVVLYGRAALLESLDDRQKGQSGDQKHAEAVLEQERMWNSK